MSSILGDYGDKIIDLLKKIVGGKQKYADTIIRNSNGDILLLQRSYQDDFMPGKWSLPGGKIEGDEEHKAAAIRELNEETAVSTNDFGGGLSFLKTIEKEKCTIHYHHALLANDDTLIVLDNNEHYRYEFVPVDRLDRYDLILDLGDILANELVPNLPFIVGTLEADGKIKNAREMDEPNSLSTSEAIKKAFDNGLIDDECFVTYLKVTGAIDTITKGYDQQLVTDAQFFDLLEKSKHYEFVKVVRDNKTFYQYREVGTNEILDDIETGTTIPTNAILDLKITKYSDRSILITGNTYKNIDLLRQAKEAAGGYGTWNKSLGGWIYPLSAKDKIMALVASKMNIGTYDDTIAKEAAISLKNAVDVTTPIIVDGMEAEVKEITTDEDGKAQYTIETKEPEGGMVPAEDELPIGTISPDGTQIKTAEGWEYIKKVTEQEIAIPPATDEKAEDLINSANEENRFKVGKELFGKEAGEAPVSTDIEEAGQNPVVAEVKEFTTRSGEKVNALNYSFVVPMDIQLVNQEDILEKPKPSWCPDINEKLFCGHDDKNFVFDYVQLEGEKILLATNGFEKKKMFSGEGSVSGRIISNKSLREDLLTNKFTEQQIRDANVYGKAGVEYSIKIGDKTFTYTGAQKEDWGADRDALMNNHKCSYAVVSLDQLVATQDYYQKKRKAQIEAEKVKKLNEALDRVRAYDDAKIVNYSVFSYERRLSEKQRKKYTKEEWESLPKDKKIEEIPFMKSPVVSIPVAHRISQMDDNHMLNSNFSMYKKFVDSKYLTPKDKGVRTYNSDDPCAIEYQEIRDALQWRKIDLRLQREENEGSYDKGVQTSYGDINLNNELLESHGVKIKLQNGKDIKENHVEQIKSALADVFSSFGNRAEMSRSFGLKISHAGEKLMFARKALGIYYPSMKAIGVSDKKETGKFGFTLAHEYAHFIDNYLGKKQGRNFASDNPYSLAGNIAKTFRANMNKNADSDYINRSCECLARAFEQYHAIKTSGEDAIKYQNVSQPYHMEDSHVSKDKFNKLIKPLIEQFLHENDHLLKSAFNELNIFNADKLIKANEAFDLIKSAFDNSEITDEIFIAYSKKYDAIVKGDPSHNGKLVKKVIVDKLGHKTTEWVKRGDNTNDKQSSTPSPKEPARHSVNVLEAFAKETPAAELKRIINEGTDEKLRAAAHAEMDRRENKERSAKKKDKPGDSVKKPEENPKLAEKESMGDGKANPVKIKPDETFKGKLILLKNTEKAPKMGSKYGQDVEPTGFFCLQKETDHLDEHPNYKTFSCDIKKPLIINVTDDLIKWKNDLSEKYKAKGKTLTAKLIKEGYDSVITTDKWGYTGEIIILAPEKLQEIDVKKKN